MTKNPKEQTAIALRFVAGQLTNVSLHDVTEVVIQSIKSDNRHMVGINFYGDPVTVVFLTADQARLLASELARCLWIDGHTPEKTAEPAR